ncbi:MAG: 3-dehydroquinate synthase [Crocinitomicaceae bacterium]|nr:3-dehydroquinate synthase [Crocinitomicaceae bacterium]
MTTKVPFSYCEINFGLLKNSSLSSIISNDYKNSRIIVFADENTYDLCLEYLFESCPIINHADVVVFPLGEENKIIEVAHQILDALSNFKLKRNDLIINLGGGIVTDMGGFISSIYKRGIKFINIPTTLLGMVDASIGGKTGINLGSYKNQIGSFIHPISIYIDSFFLKSLPQNEIINGYAEIIKHALISDAKSWFDLSNKLEKNIQPDNKLILKSITYKTSIVERDPLEMGLRKILNFGHTFGHAIEGFFVDKMNVSHGFCVCLGICAESYLSFKRGNISKDEYLQIENAINRIIDFIPFDKEAINEIYELMKQDKKNKGDQVLSCLLIKIGECQYDKDISEAEVMDAMYHLNLLAGTN